MSNGSSISELRDEEGNLTGHLVGLFHKTIHLFECGIKPIWVFDGEAPKLKFEELKRRKELKVDAKD
jgi:flap endonuclease-1